MFRVISQLEDQSIVDENDNYLFVSRDTFLKEIINGESCFSCAKSIDERSDEHVIPDWVIRLCKLNHETIVLPNNARVRYVSYKVPCCRHCNELLASHYEQPISTAFKQGFDAVAKLLDSEPERVFGWLNLITFKTHLRDLSLRDKLDLRIESGMIGDRYSWADFHHSHAVFRAPLCGTKIDRDVIGSICAMQVADYQTGGMFDYRDHLPSETVFLRIGEIAIVTILSDSGAVLDMVEGRIFLNTGPNLLQCAEVLTEYQLASMHLKNRPEFMTQLNVQTGRLEIKAKLPEQKQVYPYSKDLRGELMWYNLQPFINIKNQHGQRLEELKDKVIRGSLTFMPSE